MLFCWRTVKPVLSDHPTVQGKMVVIDRWSLKQGFPETDRFFEALLCSVLTLCTSFWQSLILCTSLWQAILYWHASIFLYVCIQPFSLK